MGGNGGMKEPLSTIKRYRIGDVAKEINVLTSRIRHWQRLFPQLKIGKSKHNQRYFSDGDVVLLKRIKDLIDEGNLTFKGIAETLKQEK